MVLSSLQTVTIWNMQSRILTIKSLKTETVTRQDTSKSVRHTGKGVTEVEVEVEVGLKANPVVDQEIDHAVDQEIDHAVDLEVRSN